MGIPSTNSNWWRGSLVLVAAIGVVGGTGCAEDPTDGRAGNFVSDNPRTDSGGDFSGDGDEAGGEDNGSGGGSGEEPPAVPAPDDPERLILEADIVQIQGDTLYALSRFSGLAIIDLSNPDSPSIIGRKQLPGEPFEMYVDGGSIYAMFNAWGHYEAVGDSWEWVQTSHVEILDVADPASIGTVASYDLPGAISDSRMVGEILYTVTFENGWCWDCQTEPNTTVTSFDLKNAASPALVDQLVLSDEGVEYGWYRSISVNQDRIYIGGVDWNSDSYDASTIQVVDISDPDGDLIEGAEVRVAGQILSRWQMDEFEGVLRVVSQPWTTSVYPRVETFEVVSSNEISPLGSTEIVTPVPESLRAVRFDGDRAFAITAEQMDPLFTIDLQNPAAPAVVGELEIPGWVYHIEPRGDRLLALGFDATNEQGGLNVSLFDVSDMTQPTLRKRVAFGGDWGSFAEDQDRIHKAFKILPDLGLILVPFSSYEWSEESCGAYTSGVQLLDWANDDLVGRGIAPIRGQARRAFVHNDRLFALSDEQLRGFDIADRDEPVKSAELQLSATVSQVVATDDLVVRLSADWWSTEPKLEISSADAPGAIEPIGSLDLGAILNEVEGEDTCYGWSYWAVKMFVHDDVVALLWPSWSGQAARLALVDISNPASPRIGDTLDLPMDAYGYGWGYYGYYGDVIAQGEPVAQAGSTLAIEELQYEADEFGYETQVNGAHIRFVDISNPNEARIIQLAQLPAGLGYTGLVADGSDVLLSHWEAAEDEGTDKVRFYLDRVGSAPGLPHISSINVPGSLVSFDAASSNLLTVDYERIALNISQQACWNTGYEMVDYKVMDEGSPDIWGDEIGVCEIMKKKLQLAHVDSENESAELLDTQSLPAGWFSNLIVGDNRVFFATNWYTWDEATQTETYSNDLHVIGGIRGGNLELHSQSLADAWWTSPVAADGQSLLAMSWPGSMVKLDASDMDDLQVEKIGEMPWYTQHVGVHDGKAYLSLGQYGLQVVDLR